MHIVRLVPRLRWYLPPPPPPPGAGLGKYIITHCMGTDSYYLSHAAEKAGHVAHLILAGRQVNDAMGRYVAERTCALIKAHQDNMENTRVLILGFTFKEDIPTRATPG